MGAEAQREGLIDPRHELPSRLHRWLRPPVKRRRCERERVCRALAHEPGINFFPTKTFETCPEERAVLFVPGGGGLEGTIAMMEDEEVLTFPSARAEKAIYVTSVCTGSLVLGAAGLLRGYKATSHWTMREVLPILEAERVDALCGGSEPHHGGRHNVGH